MDITPSLDAALASSPSPLPFLQAPGSRDHARWTAEETAWLRDSYGRLRRTLPHKTAVEQLAQTTLRTALGISRQLTSLAKTDDALRAKLRPPGVTWGPEQLARLKGMLLEGRSREECAKAFGVAPHCITATRNRYKLRTRDLLHEKATPRIPEGYELICSQALAKLRRENGAITALGARRFTVTQARMDELEAAETVTSVAKGLLARLSEQMKAHPAFHQLREAIAHHDTLRGSPPPA